MPSVQEKVNICFRLRPSYKALWTMRVLIVSICIVWHTPSLNIRSGRRGRKGPTSGMRRESFSTLLPDDVSSKSCNSTLIAWRERIQLQNDVEHANLVQGIANFQKQIYTTSSYRPRVVLWYLISRFYGIFFGVFQILNQPSLWLWKRIINLQEYLFFFYKLCE